jgi:prophage antirepressor-like protein
VKDIEQFQFGQQKVRVVERDGEPWWVAIDVCRALGMSDPRRSTDRLDREDWTITPVPDANGHEQPTVIINESGLYSLILRSRKPEAREFKRWVTSEVLPSIRRTGGYQSGATVAVTADPLRDHLAEIAWNQANPGRMAGRVLASIRWNNPQQGIGAFGEFAVQLEFDLNALTAGDDPKAIGRGDETGTAA